MKLGLGVTAITVDRRQDRARILEKEVEREPEPIPLAIKQQNLLSHHEFHTCPSHFPRKDSPLLRLLFAV